MGNFKYLEGKESSSADKSLFILWKNEISSIYL